MKQLVLAVLAVTLLAGCKTETVHKIVGPCRKCSCPAFKVGSENPEKCVNLQYGKDKLCGHSLSDHE